MSMIVYLAEYSDHSGEAELVAIATDDADQETIDKIIEKVQPMQVVRRIVVDRVVSGRGPWLPKEELGTGADAEAVW